MGNERTIPSDDPFSTMFRYVPFDIPDSKWQELSYEQSIEYVIASICEEIIDIAATVIEEHNMEKKAFEFTSRCLRVTWIRLFDWMFPRLEPYLKRDNSRKPLIIGDIEPQPLPIDSWTFGKMSQTFIQKSPSLEKTVLLPSKNAMKTTLKNRIQTKPSSIKVGKLPKRFIEKDASIKDKNDRSSVIEKRKFIKKQSAVENSSRKILGMDHPMVRNSELTYHRHTSTSFNFFHGSNREWQNDMINNHRSKKYLKQSKANNIPL